MTAHRDDDSAPPAEAHEAPKHVEVTCRKIVELLGEYVDETLPSEVKAQMEGHIGSCAPCLAFVRQYRFADEGVRKCLLKRVPEEVENRLLSFLRSRCHKPKA